LIAWLEGVLRERSPTRVVIDVHGVGYEVFIPLCTFSRLPETGKTVSLHVHTVVREDVFQLFGFATPFERTVFEMLLKANRVGPRLAQTILSGIEPERLLRALRDGDVKALRRAPGVGPKLAERMGVELRERAAELLAPSADVPGAVAVGDESEDVQGQLLSALLNLGYPRSQAERVVGAAADEAGEGASIEALIRVALRRLAR
jgi:Holliday junction DNA helicase RuvA